MAVLGTPSVSLGEVGRAEMGVWLQIFLFSQPSDSTPPPASPQRHHPSIPQESERREGVLQGFIHGWTGLAFGHIKVIISSLPRVRLAKPPGEGEEGNR